MPFDLLDGLRVVDLASEIAGPYATKLLADAGADVVKVERGSGDPLRQWSAAVHGEGDTRVARGALFEFLNAGKRAITVDLAAPGFDELVGVADVLVEDGALGLEAITRLRRAHPRITVVSVTPFGRTGPWAQRPATEFTLQAQCGSISGRGTPEREPLAVGGRLGEWVAGIYTAIGVLAAQRCRGEHVDVSIFEAMCNTMITNGPLAATLNPGPRAVPPRTMELPSIEPTVDGYVGFCTITAQQFRDFLVMIERPDLLDDADLATFRGRQARRAEFSAVIRDWTTKRTTAEIIELATLFRIPVAPIGTPETIPLLDHFVARGVFAPAPCGRFVQPRAPYSVDGAYARATVPAPRLGEHNGQIQWTPRTSQNVQPADPRILPLDGIRIVDLTAFWAGPSATHVLACFGADVIHVESIQRPDGMRLTFTGHLPSIDQWWESSSGFQQSNVNKRDVTLNLDLAEGRDLLLALVARSDAIVENFSPRVLDRFGITWETVREANPRAVMMRMPAFGLDGPWRDRPGFAQNMEQASGLAWTTGFADGPPMIPRGPCDPIAGMHAAFALLAVLHERDHSGRGHFVESSMIEAALNVAAEVVIEYEAHGISLRRDGNRGPVSAPQGLYLCRGEEQWLAVGVASDEQWRSLRTALGGPAWAASADLETARGRRACHDVIDGHLAAWAAEHELDEAVATLLAHGVPAAPVVDGPELLNNPQLRARKALETIDSPLLGVHEHVSLPFRFASNQAPWIRRPAPTLGQHNRDVLVDLLGLDEAAIERLGAAGVIGTQPTGL